MALILDGNGLIQGLSAGGLPNGSIDADSLASTLDLSSKTMTFGNVTASGITFPASQSASGNPNTLDDYEEGTWTPTITGAGGTIGAQAYSVQSGRYIKIGRFVLLTGYLILTNKGSWSGSARIEGLPFTVTNESASYSASNFYYANVTLPANNFTLGAYVDINSARAQLFASNNTGTTNSDYAIIGNGSQIGPWQICYFTSS